MAKYTTQIKSIVESGVKLFDFDYPIFDPLYKSVLEQKIVDRYYFREIGLETVGQFKHFLKMKLNEIMPYYNEQYLALQVFKTYDPYINKNLTTTESRSVTSDSENTVHNHSTSQSDGTSTETGTGNVLFSDTPQGKLSGLDYATNLTDSDTKSDTSSEGNTTEDSDGDSTAHLTTTEDYLNTLKGFDGMKYASEVYLGVKDTIINLDVLILDELNVLFMNIY